MDWTAKHDDPEADAFFEQELPRRMAEHSRAYMLYQYSITGDRLEITEMSMHAAEDAVEAGKLKGIVQGSDDEDILQITTSVTITEDSEGLLEFLENGGAELLFPENETETFVRMR